MSTDENKTYTAQELMELMQKAKDLGMTTIKVEGFEASFAPVIAPQPQFQGYSAPQPIPEDIKPEEIVTPMSVFDEPTDEEVLYWSTSHYDELQAKKQAMQAAKDSGTNEI